MNRNYLYFLLVIFIATFPVLLGSCKEKQKGESPKETTIAKKVFHKPPSGSSDTVTFKGPVVVFFYPDSGQLINIRSQLDSNEYESLVHESYYQMRNAGIALKSYKPPIRRSDINNARYLLFRKKNTEAYVVDLDKIKDIYGIYLFDGMKDPQVTDMMNIESALYFYFNK